MNTFKHRTTLLVMTLLVGLCGIAACGSGVGACVSDPVELQFSSHVYCYEGWDTSECEEQDAEEVNGAGWSFHEGQDCSDLGLQVGSNDSP